VEKGGVSLAELQMVPEDSLILLVGPPGAGKSAFCHQVVLNSIALGRPIIFVTTEQRPAQVLSGLREQGLGQATPGVLRFVDAFSQTVGVAAPERPDAIQANCMDLNSISIATTMLQERMGQKGILLTFDSLTSPYLLSGSEVVKFIRLFLSRFAAEGNSLLALIDEGCGKPEDLVAMMSLSNGVIRMEVKEGTRILSVVKHPSVEPIEIDVPVAAEPRAVLSCFDTEYMRRQAESLVTGTTMTLRPGLGDYVNIAWRDLIFWSGMLWDPKRFPTMMYELTKYSDDSTNFGFDLLSLFPWHRRLLFKHLFPKIFSRVKDMKKVFEMTWKTQFTQLRIATAEYLDGVSKTDEHYIRLDEHYECWGFENVGASLGIMKTAMMAGNFKGQEWLLGGGERDWNAVETKCIGLGDPYCEFKVVPGEIEGLTDSLEKDSEVIERVYDRLMDRLMGFMLHGKPLMKRPTLDSGVHIHEVHHVTAAPLVNERLRMVFRMGGARMGKMLGERLMEAGLGEDDAVRRIFDLMEHCKVGTITLRPRSGQALRPASGQVLGEKIRMRENCERFGIKTEEPSCYFTTGLLNGLFSTVKNQHVREIKCIAPGDPYCEWEITS
jgi:predicted hydrocarbon binding protein/KaiC/GvpD/RAD55 family RecA-like ATPase